MKFGNYFYIVSEDADGVLNKTYNEIKAAADMNCLVVLVSDDSGVTLISPLGAFGEVEEDTYGAIFMTAFDGAVAYKSADPNGYPQAER